MMFVAVYKYIYAVLLAEFGLLQTAKEYCCDLVPQGGLCLAGANIGAL